MHACTRHGGSFCVRHGGSFEHTFVEIIFFLLVKKYKFKKRFVHACVHETRGLVLRETRGLV